MWFSQCLPTPCVQSFTLPSPASVRLAINSFILILKVAYSRLIFDQLCLEMNLYQPDNPFRFLGGNTSRVSSHASLDLDWGFAARIYLECDALNAWLLPESNFVCNLSIFCGIGRVICVTAWVKDSQPDHRDKIRFGCYGLLACFPCVCLH